MQLPFRDIARNLNIAIGTVCNIWKKFVDTGDVTPRKADFVNRRYLTDRDELLILGILYEDCTSYLSEICQQVVDVTGTVEPPKRGHFGNGTFVLSSEVVLFSEIV